MRSVKHLVFGFGIMLSACGPSPEVSERAPTTCGGEALQVKKEAASKADVIVRGYWKLSDPQLLADGFVAIGQITPTKVVKGDFDKSVPTSIMTGEIASSLGETLECAVAKPGPDELRTFFLRRAEKYYQVVDHRAGLES
jgi:hypothetical protein